jgi:hypothetical protein
LSARCRWLTPTILATSRDRDQEDYGLKPAKANSSTRPYLEKPFTKIGLVESKQQYCKNKNQTKPKKLVVFVTLENFMKLKFGLNQIC